VLLRAGEDLGEEEKIAEKNKQSLGAGGQHEENSHADMDYSGFGVSLKEIAERSPLEQTLVEEALRDKARNKARRVRPRKAKFNANLISPALQKGLNRLTVSTQHLAFNLLAFRRWSKCLLGTMRPSHPPLSLLSPHSPRFLRFPCFLRFAGTAFLENGATADARHADRRHGAG
jgi:hypothetical protein